MQNIEWKFSILRISGLSLSIFGNFVFVLMTMSGTPKSEVLSMVLIRTIGLSLPFALWACISIFTAKPSRDSFFHHLTWLILIFTFPVFFIANATLITHPPGELFPTSALVLGSFPIVVPLLYLLAKPLGLLLQKLFPYQ